MLGLRELTKRLEVIVSIHAPTRGATYDDMGRHITVTGFQSTLPRGERPAVIRAWAAATGVSIHAPTRGATKRREIKKLVPQVSIHAPTRGATAEKCPPPYIALSFNPRSHAGSDSPNLSRSPAAVLVSIHAPTRGATVASSSMRPPSRFQSTLPRGERREMVVNAATVIVFQSTLPRGERPSSARRSRRLSRFNPRSHAGSDSRPLMASIAS